MSEAQLWSRPAGQLDTAPLTTPIDDAALAAFVAESKRSGKPWRQMTTGLPRPGAGELIGKLIPVVIPAIGLLAMAYVGGPKLGRAIWEFTWEAPFPLNLVIVGVVALILLGVLVALGQVVRVIRSMIIPGWWWRAAYRLVGFADRNGLHYGHDEPVNHPGIIFGTGIDRVAARRLINTVGRRVEIGNYRYTIPAEDRENSQVHHWGYVAITLDRRLPHMLLDAKANNRGVLGVRVSNLPVGLANDQKLALGGEFDTHFTLYAPREYGRDAFYVFTPDLMALFIDRLGTFDVEIVDDTMFVYGDAFDLLDPRTYAWLSELVDTVVARTVRRTERYTDDFAALEANPIESGSAGDPGPARNVVAAHGRRLRRRTWGVWSFVGLALLAFWIYNEFVAPLFGWPHLQ